MDRKEKIKVIYDTIANKERTFGCNYIIKDRDWHEYEVRETEWECVNLTYWDSYEVDEWYDSYDINYLVSIIGHPVMIWDVFDYINEEKIDVVWSNSSCTIDARDGGQSIDIFNLWEHKRKPIEEQSDECINFIYSLIENNA